MAPPPLVTGVSPKEGPPGTRITIRGENFGRDVKDFIGTICINSLLNDSLLHMKRFKAFVDYQGSAPDAPLDHLR